MPLHLRTQARLVGSSADSSSRTRRSEYSGASGDGSSLLRGKSGEQMKANASDMDTRSLPENRHVALLDNDSVSLIVNGFEQGDITHTEAFDMLLGLIHDDNIDALIASVPETWREEFAEFLTSYAQPKFEWVEIFGGIKSWEREPDSSRREEGRRADQQRREAERAHFHAVILPCIHAWIKRRGVLP